MEMTRGDDGVVVRLTSSEALVLFDMLHRWEDARLDADVRLFADPAEERVLWDLTAGLEPTIDVVFAADYARHLEAARAQLRY